MDYNKLVIEEMKDGSGVYITRRPGEVTRSIEAHEVVTLDLDKTGNLIGVEILASPLLRPEQRHSDA